MNLRPSSAGETLRSQINYVDVGSEAHVIRQVVADIIGIVIDHNVVIVPEPVAAIAVVIRRDLEEEATDIEAVRSATAQPPNMLRSKAGGEASMLPGMIEMVVGIIAATFMPNPLIVFRMDVRCFRMAFAVAVTGVLFTLLGLLLSPAVGRFLASGSFLASGILLTIRRCMRCCRRTGRAVRWNMPVADALVSIATVLASALRLRMPLRLRVPLGLLTLLLAAPLGKGEG